jgi:predicted aspartyl protease
MQPVFGFFKGSTPCCKLKISGLDQNTALEFTAIIDTGFDGFLLMPTPTGVPLGLVGRVTTEIIQADGKEKPTSAGEGLVGLGGQERQGLIILQDDALDILIGTELLKAFGALLLCGSQVVVIFDEANMMAAAGQPMKALADITAAESAKHAGEADGAAPD